VIYISWSHDPTDLLHRIQIRTETTVHGENLLIYDCGNGQAVEAVGECFPQLDIVPALTFVIEAVDTVDGSTFMIAAQDEKVFRILDLVCKEQADSLE